MKNKTKGLYFIHGTWGTSKIWYDNKFLIPEIKKIFNYNKATKEVLFDWNGGNMPKYRISEAKRFMETVINDLSLFSNKQITLVGHSHGGSVAITALNKGLASFAKKNGLAINLVTINTPVIKDDNVNIANTYGSSINLLNKDVLKFVNHYHIYAKDFVQHRGGATYIKKGKEPIGIGWQNGGTKSKRKDYKKSIAGAAYRFFKNGKTKNIKYRSKYKIYFSKEYTRQMNYAGVTGHQGWRAKEVGKWLPLLKGVVLK